VLYVIIKSLEQRGKPVGRDGQASGEHQEKDLQSLSPTSS